MSDVLPAVESSESAVVPLEAQVVQHSEYPADVCTMFTFPDGSQLLLHLRPEAAAIYAQQLTVAALCLMPPQGHA